MSGALIMALSLAIGWFARAVFQSWVDNSWIDFYESTLADDEEVVTKALSHLKDGEVELAKEQLEKITIQLEPVDLLK